jgi:hypothetical protein
MEKIIYYFLKIIFEINISKYLKNQININSKKKI